MSQCANFAINFVSIGTLSNIMVWNVTDINPITEQRLKSSVLDVAWVSVDQESHLAVLCEDGSQMTFPYVNKLGTIFGPSRNSIIAHSVQTPARTGRLCSDSSVIASAIKKEVCLRDITRNFGLYWLPDLLHLHEPVTLNTHICQVPFCLILVRRSHPSMPVGRNFWCF